MRSTPFLILAMIGCTSSAESEAPHFEFSSDIYTLQPGEEKYFCYTTTLPADRDIAITKLTPTYGLGTHHILFSQALAPEPEGFSECPVLSKQSWVPMYAGGVGSNALELPPQVAFKPFARGQQVIMQLHLQNASDVPISARAAMRLDYVDATPDILQAGIFGFDNQDLVIPPHTPEAMNEMSCVMGVDLDVFAALGHMHKHGVRLELSRGATPGAEMLLKQDWDFDAQPITSLPVKLQQGDTMHLRCFHENDGDLPILWGESSDTEMCIVVLYYAPIGPRGSCIKPAATSR
jgi:hypothetical protein